MVKNLPAMQETWLRFLGQEDPLENGWATCCSILAWNTESHPIAEFHPIPFNSIDRGAAVHGVAKSQTRLSDTNSVLKLKWWLFSRSFMSNSLQPHGL